MKILYRIVFSQGTILPRKFQLESMVQLLWNTFWPAMETKLVRTVDIAFSVVYVSKNELIH